MFPPGILLRARIRFHVIKTNISFKALLDGFYFFQFKLNLNQAVTAFPDA